MQNQTTGIADQKTEGRREKIRRKMTARIKTAARVQKKKGAQALMVQRDQQQKVRGSKIRGQRRGDCLTTTTTNEGIKKTSAKKTKWKGDEIA